MENTTVFDLNKIAFDEGINILIGENGTGETHILKKLYSACQAANPEDKGKGYSITTVFSNKTNMDCIQFA